MNSFATPEWDSNPIADKTCNELFKGRTSSVKQKNKKKKANKNKKQEIRTGRIEKTKTKQQKQKSNVKNYESIKPVKQFDLKKFKPNKINTNPETFNNNPKNNKKQEIRTGRIEKTKTKQQKQKSNVKNYESIKPVKQFDLKKFKPNKINTNPETFNNNPKNNKKQKIKSHQKHTINKSKQNETDEGENKHLMKQKLKVTHQTLFSQTSRKNWPKTNENQQRFHASNNPPELKERITSKKKLKRLKKKMYKANQKASEASEDQEHKAENDKTNESNINKNAIKKTKGKQMQKLKEKLKTTLEEGKSFLTTLNKKQKAALPLRERMLEKLKAGRFRYLNEQMYTSEGKNAKKFFESDRDAYQAYHEGYKQQVARWPLNPVDIIIEKIKKMPKTHIIADFGCGEAKLAKSVPQTVRSFDLVAIDESVTACDMAHVPLIDGSVNVVVFCLSLMGTNLKDYLLEAHRVLKIGGLLKIAEVESRFDKVDDFIKNVQSFGFVKTAKDLSHDLFCFLDFVKKESNVKQKKKLPNFSLNPCLYKKR